MAHVKCFVYQSAVTSCFRWECGNIRNQITTKKPVVHEEFYRNCLELRAIMTWSDVAEAEELSQPEVTPHADI